jgi:acetyl-CoA carboxylase biotin carboxylase subunit
MFKKILVANRGEIALRVISTCREMGIETVAVYSDADLLAAHVLAADHAVGIGPPEPNLSYLNLDAIIAATKATNAQAIHPGYGFLSENPEFANRCENERIVFIGPSSRVIREMGDKITARNIMVRAGVPVTPGLTTAITDPATLLKEAETLGYPVLIKATAGGGGKGIRRVDAPSDLIEASQAASREALGAFGNGDIYIEKFFTRTRHIEFQILADTFGNTLHLFERECSVQRRHQKIIEETPATSLTPDLRQEMGKAAVAAAKAADYTNAGTVEFLVDEANNFYFLEMNTRLQVEHPVTEMTTGIDLVRQQLLIAAGNPLEYTQKEIVPRGHSIECRIYAEDPEKAFFPCPGRIDFIEEPTGPGIRNDCGVYSGAEVPVEYDPILSKLVVHAESRELAIAKMVKALKEYVILGVRTPTDFLMDLLRSDPFVKGEVFTNFIDQHFSDWQPGNTGDAMAMLAFITDELLPPKTATVQADGNNTVVTPFQTLGNWQL